MASRTTKRAKKYFWSKSKFGRIAISSRKKFMESMLMFGMAGSRVWKDENGKVNAIVLSIEEMEEVLEKQRNGETIADEEYSFV